MRPYPEPERIATRLRCQFSLPGRRYDCRHIGHYVLNGKRYCATHYDTKWKFMNPIYGQQHDWHIHLNRFTGEADKYETCKRCGSVKQHEGLAQEPCYGKMPRITLRACNG